jgi:hypothetical protein
MTLTERCRITIARMAHGVALPLHTVDSDVRRELVVRRLANEHTAGLLSPDPRVDGYCADLSTFEAEGDNALAKSANEDAVLHELRGRVGLAACTLGLAKLHKFREKELNSAAPVYMNSMARGGPTLRTLPSLRSSSEGGCD